MAVSTTSVLILMALRNAGRHLEPQLESFVAQTHTDWALLVGDDGSQDDGPDRIRAFAAAHPDRSVRLVEGPRQGYARNFVSLIRQAGPDVPMVALSDQDDVWFPSKLARAAAAMQRAPADRPVLYCARTVIAGPDLTPLSEAPHWHRPFGFANALVQNVAAGNTIVLNRAAIDLAQRAADRIVAADLPMVAHDWWLYQLVTGAGGLVVRDPEPVLYYRQHHGNLMGRNDTLGARLFRLRALLSGGVADWNATNIAVLRAHEDLLEPEARARLAAFERLRHAGLFERIALLRSTGLYRQTGPANLAFRFMALAGRL